jgi:hypothetical protein
MTEQLMTYDLARVIRSQFGDLAELEDWDSGPAHKQKIGQYDPNDGYIRFEAVIDVDALFASIAPDLGGSTDIDITAMAGTSEYILLDPADKSWVNRYKQSSMNRDGSIAWVEQCHILYQTPDAVREYKIDDEGGEFKKVTVSITKREHLGEQANPGPSASVELDDNFQKSVHLAGETKAGLYLIDRAKTIILSQGGDPNQDFLPWVVGMGVVLDGHTNSALARASESSKGIKFFTGKEVPLPETPYNVLMQQRGSLRTLRRTSLITKGFWELSFFADNHLRAITDTMTGDKNQWSNMSTAFPIDLQIKH